MSQNQQHENHQAGAQSPQVVDITDPKVLLGILSQMFQQQSESTEINRKLLAIQLREEEARLKKDAEALEKWRRAREAALSELKHFDANRKRRWATCPGAHKDKNGVWTIWPISNYPDGRLRGYCTQCTMPIEPEHYEYDAHGNATKVEAHPLYNVVLERDQQIYSGFLAVMNY